MYVGHINLARSTNAPNDNFVRLIESLQQHGLHQYVIVRDKELAKRLDIVAGVTVGPCVRTAVTANCLMPIVDVVHLHEQNSWQAGLLLMLTRSIPYVLTEEYTAPVSGNPVMNAVRRRAAGVIDPDVSDVDAHLQLYRQAAGRSRTPIVL